MTIQEGSFQQLSATEVANPSISATHRVVLGRVAISDVVEEASTVAAVPRLEDQLVALRTAFAEIESELEQKNRELAALQSDYAQLQTEQDATAAELISLQQQLTTAEQEAQQRGYAEGFDQSADEVQTQLEVQAAAWRDGLEALVEQHELYCQELSAQMADLVMAAVTKVIGENLATANHIKAAIDHIVHESGELNALKIYVAPLHYEQLQTLENVQLGSIRGRAIELYPDSRIEYGGCLLEGASGLTDGRYEVQLAKLREIVRSGV